MDNNSTVRILVGADIVPTPASAAAFEQADLSALLGQEAEALLQNADLRFFNLETPLADQASPIKKYGPKLLAPTAAIAGIKALQPSCLTLANNHILDHGQSGLSSTLRLLEENAIPYTGVGATPAEAAKGWITTVKGKTIGLYACAEHEFSIVTDKTAGANPYDPLESFDAVAALREKCDYVIVLYHGGKEYYRYPSPELQKRCRKFVEKGAGLVVCQHSHCIGCQEAWEGGVIVYGQGNFLFEKRDNEFWNQSLLVGVTLEDGGAAVEYYPLCRKAPGARLAQGAESEQILAAFQKRSEEIQTPGFVEKNYLDFAKKNAVDAAKRLDGGFSSKLYSGLNRLSGGRLSAWRMKRLLQKRKNALCNIMDCEAWHELLLTYLKSLR